MLLGVFHGCYMSLCFSSCMLYVKGGIDNRGELVPLFFYKYKFINANKRNQVYMMYTRENT